MPKNANEPMPDPGEPQGEAADRAAPAGQSPASSEGPRPASFEAALAELEKLVAKMESGSLSLEQSLASHRRGLSLARFCQERLAQAEQQVKILEDDMLRAFPAERDDDGETEPGDDD